MKTVVYIILFITNCILISSCTFTNSESEFEDADEVNTNAVNIPLSAHGITDTSQMPKIFFEQETYNFGTIIQGEKVSYSFKFKNIGGGELLISNVQGSCGCTVAKYSKDPILPGNEGTIDIIFDSNGKSGHQNKTVTVMTNCQPSQKILTFTAEVIVPDRKE